MANRSYLYSSNFVPGRDDTIGARRIVGISEWNYDIPIVFKLLVSVNPRRCRSLLFDSPDEIAIVGDFDAGVNRLMQFLDQIGHPAIESLKDEAEEFFASDGNTNDYFLLECGEIFMMDSIDLGEQAASLFGGIRDIEPDLTKAKAHIEARLQEEIHPPGFFARLFGATRPVRQENSTELVFTLGLGNWSNTLYYEPNVD